MIYQPESGYDDLPMVCYLLFNVALPVAMVLMLPYEKSVLAADSWVTLEAIFWLAICSSAFFGVYRSDPGYLTNDAMERFEKACLDTTRTKRRRRRCRPCRIAPPLRSHHCRICKICVATFDHHCLYIGTCIGERNRGRFLWFLAMNEFALARGVAAFFRISRDSAMSAIVGVAKVYLSVFFFGCTILFVSQFFMVLTNSTSFEWRYSTRLGYLLGNHPIRMPFFVSLAHCWEVLNQSSFDDDNWTPFVWDPPVCVPCPQKKAAPLRCRNLKLG